MQLNTATFGRPNRRRSMVLHLLPYALPLIAVLYLVLPALTLLILGWHYLGGGMQSKSCIPPHTFCLWA